MKYIIVIIKRYQSRISCYDDAIAAATALALGVAPCSSMHIGYITPLARHAHVAHATSTAPSRYPKDLAIATKYPLILPAILTLKNDWGSCSSPKLLV
jgi:hypothetical protein